MPAATIDHYLKPGTKRWFEYHCWESPTSADAELWYRSHQRVTVVDCDNAEEYGGWSREEREDNGTPLVYNIRFEDGHIGSAFEDELMTTRKHYSRPNPPKRGA